MLPLQAGTLLCRVVNYLLVKITLFAALTHSVVKFGRDCAAACSSCQPRALFNLESFLPKQSRASLHFRCGAHDASKPTIFSLIFPPDFPLVDVTWPTRVHPIPYDAFFMHHFGPAYSSDCTGDGPPTLHFAYSAPPRNNFPYRIVRRIYKDPVSMSLMRGEYRKPQYFSNWLKFFLHVGRYYYLCRKRRRECKLIRRTWLYLLKMASAHSFTHTDTSTLSSPPSDPLIMLAPPLPHKRVVMHASGCNRVVEYTIQMRKQCTHLSADDNLERAPRISVRLPLAHRQYVIIPVYPRRTYTPHVATNPVNSTPDHDPDKE